MFSCKAAFTMRFFHSHTGIVQALHQIHKISFSNTRLRLSRLPHKSHFCVDLSFDERGASTQGQISCRVALKLQRRTELLVQRNACGLWKRLQRAALFYDPKCLFLDRALG